MLDLSVVIPTFNTAPMTLRCCAAVLATTPAGTEVIVVDDGSSDDTVARFTTEMPGVRIIRMDSNAGFAPAANRGVEATRGRVILLLNSDAMVEAGALQAFLAAFEGDDTLGIAGARLLDEDGTAQWSGGREPTLAWMAGVVSGAGSMARFFRRRGNAAPAEVSWVSGAAMAFRREVWNAAGPLSERFRFYCQDLDFCVAAHDRGWRVRIVPEARVRHGLGQTVAAGSSLRHDPERLWPDLFAWGTARYGRWWSRLARVVLLTAAALRIAGRVVRHPLRRDPTTASLVRATRRLIETPGAEA